MSSRVVPLDIFTDGSFDAGTRSGGWAFVVTQGDQRICAMHGRATANSNNSLELLAVIEAISWLARSGDLPFATIWTDSAHVVDGCRHWRAIWRNNGWKRITANRKLRKRAVPDAQLWIKLDEQLDRHPEVTVAWCKGHAGLVGNETADALARAGTVKGASAPRSRWCRVASTTDIRSAIR